MNISFPFITSVVERPEKITVFYYDEELEEREEYMEGFKARVF